MSNQNPIADLTYRNYDGPLTAPSMRWWIIARNTMRMAIKNRWLWFMAFIGGAYYFVMIAVLFVIDRIATSSPNGSQMQEAFLGRLQWKEQFFHGLSYAQMPTMIIAMMVGAGAIANDNRANALLVYLSKPCTKFDYAFGKWIGVFIVLITALGLPVLFFYAYGALSFRELGFFKQDPYLLPKLLAVIPINAAISGSLVLAISSLFRQGRLAGAVYAGLYFLGYFFTIVIGGIWIFNKGKAGPLVAKLYYTSIDGIQIGLTKAILGARGGNVFGTDVGRRMRPIPAPPLTPTLIIAIILIVVCIAITWRRVRAVEVVG